MLPNSFPLRWASTRDQWWYASPIDWAAANGHYDLVRELLRIDPNNLMNLTSLRRNRRLEAVWDEEEKFHEVAKCRAKIAKSLFHDCESLLEGGYGGWLLYTAVTAGDLPFVHEILERNPLLVFGEGEYGITCIFYAAARSMISAIFWIVYDFAVSPRFKVSKEVVKKIGEVPFVFKTEIMTRAIHAAARAGNSAVVNELLRNCEDVLAYRDKYGSTILHAAAARGQVEVINNLVLSFDIITTKDNLGNTALHVAAYRGQVSTVQALITANPSLISSVNNAGDTFLHMAIAGFSSPSFRRLDRQILLMKKLLNSEIANFGGVINAKNKDGRSPLHMAVISNVHSELLKLLMSAPGIDLNSRDNDGMTPLDLLKQQSPINVSSEILIRELISSCPIFGSDSARIAMVSQMKLEGSVGSPGTSFRTHDAEILLHAGVQIPTESEIKALHSIKQDETTDEDPVPKNPRRNTATHRLKKFLRWPRSRTFKEKSCGSQVTPISSPEILKTPNNKRIISARSSFQTSPIRKSKRSTELIYGAAQALSRGKLNNLSAHSMLTSNGIKTSIF